MMNINCKCFRFVQYVLQRFEYHRCVENVVDLLFCVFVKHGPILWSILQGLRQILNSVSNVFSASYLIEN